MQMQSKMLIQNPDETCTRQCTTKKASLMVKSGSKSYEKVVEKALQDEINE